MIRDIYAFAFHSELSLLEMLQRLNERGPWQWTARDNNDWGDYIVAGAIEPPHRGVVKILEDDGHFAINIELKSEAPDPQVAFASVRSIVLDQILPALEARDVVDTDDYD